MKFLLSKLNSVQNNDHLNSQRFHIILLAGMAFLIMMPILLFGIYNGVDLPQHFQMAVTFYKSILSGNLYPSWAGDENLGYGGLDVRFYPPLTAFFMALARIIFGNWHLATCVNIFSYTFIGCLGVYFWAKEFVSSRQAMWAGLVFAVMPYRLSEIYNGFVFAEYAGCSILIFSFLFTSKVCRRGNLSDVLGLAISFSILILTHLPLTVIGSVSLSVYALTCFTKENIRKSFLKLSTAVLFALSATSFYWLKMITEMNWLRGTRFRTDNHFDFSYNFLLTSPWFGEKLLWYLNIVLITTVFLTIVSYLIYLRKNNGQQSTSLFSPLVLFIFSASMTIFISQPIWKIIPFLSEVQFPWRWLTVASASGSIIVGANIESFWRILRNKLSENRSALLEASAFISVFSFITILCLTWTIFIGNYITKNDMEDWVAQKSNSMGFDFFWTPQTKESVFEVSEKIVTNNRQFIIDSWKPDSKNFTVEPGEKDSVRIATLLYPYWKAQINGKPIDLLQTDDGAILLPIPTEKSTVIIWFEEPELIKIATYMAIIIWLAFAIIFFSNLASRFVPKSRQKIDYQSS